jgi:hypothetical protein
MTDPTRLPRGIRNHNPGNIRRVASVTWKGQSPAQTDPEFVVFAAPEWGIRAIARILLSYRRRGVVTVHDIIHRWAPPAGRGPNGSYSNPTDAYVTAVARHMGIGPNVPIDVTQPDQARALIAEIIRHENGQQPYGRATLDAGLHMAGLELSPDTEAA